MKLSEKNLYTVMICWQKYLSLCKYSKLLHGYKFQNKLYLRRKNQQLHNSRQKPKLTLKYQEEEQSLLASDYSAWCCQDTAKKEISALFMTFSNSDAETVNCKSLPFFYFLIFEKGRLLYIRPVGRLVGRLVG